MDNQLNEKSQLLRHKYRWVSCTGEPVRFLQFSKNPTGKPDARSPFLADTLDNTAGSEVTLGVKMCSIQSLLV